MDRRALSGLFRAYGPHLLIALGVVKAIGVAALAPLVGAPMWLALTAAALWVGGPAVAALLWKRWDARRAPVTL